MSLADGRAVQAESAIRTGPAAAPGRPRAARRAPVRGRPRSEAVERAIIEGVIALLEDGVSLGELSIERVARTAGVGKATIYRRWNGKEALFLDVVRAMEPADAELPGTSMRDDLIAIVEAVRRRGVANRTSALLHNVYAQMKAHPQLWDAYYTTAIAPRRRATLDVLRRGLARGELRPGIDLELANDLIVGPMLARSALRPDADLPEGLAEQIVDSALAGLGPTN